MRNILEIKNLVVSYGGIEAVKGIDLTVEQGKIVTLIGSNGAGKSTTLKAVAGLVRPKSGEILLDGTNLVGKSTDQIVSSGVTLVPEGRRVFENLTVAENLRIGAYLRKDPLADDLARVYDLFPRLKERAWQQAGTLSGGEQQKMVLRSPPPYVPDSRVQLYTPAFRAQYLALHDDDRYWTGERVLAAQDTFRVLLAIEDGAVAGYLDLTYRNAENEPYDLFVREKSRRRGLGRALLSCAIEKNRPNAMSLLVDSDNLAARRLYASLDFVEKPEENNITAHLKL